MTELEILKEEIRNFSDLHPLSYWNDVRSEAKRLGIKIQHASKDRLLLEISAYRRKVIDRCSMLEQEIRKVNNNK